jgi:hypothetical protein
MGRELDTWLEEYKAGELTTYQQHFHISKETWNLSIFRFIHGTYNNKSTVKRTKSATLLYRMYLNVDKNNVRESKPNINPTLANLTLPQPIF